MNIFLAPLALLLCANLALSSVFEPLILSDANVDRNYELINYFATHSQHLQDNSINQFLNAFIRNYQQGIKNSSIKDSYYEQYMSRLALFFANVIHKYQKNNTAEALEVLRLNNSDEPILSYAEKLYFLYKEELFQGAEIAFKENLSVDDVESLKFHDAVGIDVVYENTNIINSHLINMIFYKLLRSNPKAILTSSTFGLSLPVDIWFKLIMADQKAKMLISRENFQEAAINDPKIIIEELVKDKKQSKEEILNQLLNGLFSFTVDEFSILENSFKIIETVEDLKNFNQKKHFFLFRHINYKDKNNTSFLLMSSIFERATSNNENNYHQFFNKKELISKFNTIASDHDKKDEIINLVINNYSKSISPLFKDLHCYDKDINSFLNKGYFEFIRAYEGALRKLYNAIWSEFARRSHIKIGLKEILKLLEDYDYLFKIKIDNITQKLEKTLSKELFKKYQEFTSIWDYKSFKNVKIVDYEYSSSAELAKIKSYRYNIELFKILFSKLAKDKIIKFDSSQFEIVAQIMKYGNLKMNNEPINIFEKYDLFLSDVNNLRYATKTKKLFGIDVFIFNKYLRETFSKIFFMSENQGSIQMILSKSDKLNLQLTLFEWFSLLQTEDRIPNQNSDLFNSLFIKITNNYKTIDSFINFNNEHCFLDNYITSNRVSLRRDLFRHYLRQAYEDDINLLRADFENVELKQRLKSNFNLFLEKIKYDNKILIPGDALLLEQQDKDIIDDYFSEITKSKQAQSFFAKKKQRKNSKPKKVSKKPSSSEKKLDPKKNSVSPALKNVNLTNNALQTKKINSQSKPASNKSASKQKNEPTKNNPKESKKVKKEPEPVKNSSLLESIDFLRYKLVKERNKFIDEHKSTEIRDAHKHQVKEAKEPKEVKENKEAKEVKEELKEELKEVKKLSKNTPRKKGIKKKVKKFFKQVETMTNLAKDMYKGNAPQLPFPSLFFSENNSRRIYENHKIYLKDRAKNKEDYEKIALEISYNFHYNILALDEFIHMLLYESSFKEYEERNNLVTQAWHLMQQVLNSPLSQQVELSNLAQQISNAFYALEEAYIQFFDIVYSNSSYYNFAGQLLNVDGAINEEELANLLTWAGSEIKYKSILSDMALRISNLYSDIINCSKELQKKIVHYEKINEN
jgi:hypothetical protein